MIKIDELREFRPQVKYQNGNGITLITVQDAIKDCATKMGIPMAFKYDKVKLGGWFNSSVDDCLVLYHPEHERDYFKFCVRINHQGVYAFVSINDFGRSSQMTKMMLAEEGKADRAGKKMSYKIGSLIGTGLTTIGKSKAKLEEEQRYYQCVMDIFDEIVC